MSHVTDNRLSGEPQDEPRLHLFVNTCNFVLVEDFSKSPPKSKIRQSVRVEYVWIYCDSWIKQTESPPNLCLLHKRTTGCFYFKAFVQVSSPSKSVFAIS